MRILKCHFLPFSNRSEDLFPSVIPLTVLYVTTKWQNWFAKRVLGSFLINRVYIFPFKCVTQHIFSLFWIAGSSPQCKHQSFYKLVCTNSYESYLVFCIKFIPPFPFFRRTLFSLSGLLGQFVTWSTTFKNLKASKLPTLFLPNIPFQSTRNNWCTPN